MKKTQLFASLLLASILSVSMVSAYYLPSFYSASQGAVQMVMDFFQPILVALFGAYSYTYVFEILLIFLIIASVVYIALGRIDMIKEQKAVRWILTIVIPLLGVRFIDYTWLITILQTYQLLAIVITCILPFIIYFMFLYNIAGDHGIIRKIGWALWVAVYIGLYSAPYANDITSTVYFWTFIVGIICLFGDNIIYRRYLAIAEIKRSRNFINTEVTRINEQIRELNAALRNGTAHNPSITKSQIRDLEKHTKWLLKQ